MNTATPIGPVELAAKIARLVEERGWNQEDFARIAGLNRLTVRQILRGPVRNLRNATIQTCARALGLTVSELRALPLERLLPRMRGQHESPGADALKAVVARVTQPELLAWLQRNEDRARQLTPNEIEEVLAIQGPDGPLAAFGVERVIEMFERKRELLRRVGVVAGSEYLALLEQLVGLLYEKVRPLES